MIKNTVIMEVTLLNKMKELSKQYSAYRENNHDIAIWITEKDISLWVRNEKPILYFRIIGPKETVYEGGFFGFYIWFQPNYPNEPPIIKTMMDIYHPNIRKLPIEDNRDVCLTYNSWILWSKFRHTSIFNMITDVKELFYVKTGKEVNVNSPLDFEAADVFVKDRPEFDKRAKERTARFHSVDCAPTEIKWFK